MRSTAGYIIGLIAGILGMIGSLTSFIQYQVFLRKGSFNLFSISLLGIDPSVIIIFFVFWTFILSVIIIISSIQMNKDDDETVKKAGIITLIASVLAMQILGIIAGIVGIIQSGEKKDCKKKKRFS